jgi:hypothetical protein
MQGQRVKEYAVFASPFEACEFVEEAQGGSYYEVIEHKGMPCVLRSGWALTQSLDFPYQGIHFMGHSSIPPGGRC